MLRGEKTFSKILQKKLKIPFTMITSKKQQILNDFMVTVQQRSLN